MKNVTIDTAASWVGTFRSWQDGDVFRESNCDLIADDFAERLGYLKAQEALSFKLPSNNAVLGDNTHAGTETFNGTAIFNGNATFTDQLEVNTGVLALFGGVVQLDTGAALCVAKETLSDAADTIVETVCRVPTLTANRTYTLPAAEAGQIVFFSRPRTADAFTATLQDPTGPTTLGVVPISAAGWIVAYCDGSAWKPILWSSNITSLMATV